MLIALIATMLGLVLAVGGAVMLWAATGKWRDEHARVLKELLQERERHIAERDAWARAAADERAQLLAAAADERAALVGAIDAARNGQPAFVAPPWPADPQERQFVTEDDEIMQAREAMVREVEAMATQRGINLEDAIQDGVAS